MKVFAIDPSINHLGWVLMSPGEVLLHGTMDAPTEFKRGDFVERLSWMMGELNDWMGTYVVDVIAIEQPETWGAYKSMASDRSGSLQILTMLVGALTQWAIIRLGAENVQLVKVSQHKGQLPKRVTQSRMERKYNCKFATDHEADACSVGDYVLSES